MYLCEVVTRYLCEVVVTRYLCEVVVTRYLCEVVGWVHVTHHVPV